MRLGTSASTIELSTKFQWRRDTLFHGFMKSSIIWKVLSCLLNLTSSCDATRFQSSPLMYGKWLSKPRKYCLNGCSCLSYQGEQWLGRLSRMAGFGHVMKIFIGASFSCMGFTGYIVCLYVVACDNVSFSLIIMLMLLGFNLTHKILQNYKP